MVDAFTIKVHWPKNSSQGVDATFCQMQIWLSGKNVAAYRDECGEEQSSLQFPSYYLAEWLAENWWPLLWEPRKSEEDGENEDFSERHNILTAQHGFALPSVSFASTGSNIDVYAGARRASHSSARFNNSASSLITRGEVERQFRKFIEGTIERLALSVRSPLEEAWEQVKSTDADHIFYCQLFGALGLSPYENHPEIDAALDSASEVLGPTQLLELCQTSTPHNIGASAQVATAIPGALERSTEIDLSALAQFPVPAQPITVPAYRCGYQAAEKLRSHFKVKENDVDGARLIFEKLNLAQLSDINCSEAPDTPISGATTRKDFRGKMTLVRSKSRRRRFSLGRATYFLWTGGQDRGHLITDAVTREQQASRAFAAELLVPRAYVRAQASSGKIRNQKVFEIADREDVSPAMIKWQAQNMGLQIV